jgi:hypothetical protein
MMPQYPFLFHIIRTIPIHEIEESSGQRNNPIMHHALVSIVNDHGFIDIPFPQSYMLSYDIRDAIVSFTIEQFFSHKRMVTAVSDTISLTDVVKQRGSLDHHEIQAKTGVAQACSYHKRHALHHQGMAEDMIRHFPGSDEIVGFRQRWDRFFLSKPACPATWCSPVTGALIE